MTKTDLIDECWLHKWKQIHKSPIIGSGSYFVHRRCAKCNRDDVRTHNPFFSSIDEAIALGTATGIYKAITLDKCVEKALDRAFKEHGL